MATWSDARHRDAMGWTVMRAFLWSTAIGLALAVCPAVHARVDADRIGKLVDKGKFEKAAELCQGRLAEGPVEDAGLVEACGAAELRRLTTDPAAEPAPEDLRVLCRDWPGSSAADEAWELLARSLVEGEQDTSTLDELAREFQGTEAARDAARRVWEAVAATRDLDGVGVWIAGHPDSPHLDAAGVVQAELAWERAEAAGTAAGWRELIEECSDHPRRAEAATALREARFREAAEASPAEMLAVAQEFPDDERSAELARRAWVGAVQVQAIPEQGDPRPLVCSFDGANQPVALEQSLRGIRISADAGFIPSGAELAVLRGGGLDSVTTLGAEIADSGLPREFVDSMTRIPDSGAGIEGAGDLPAPAWLCRPSTEDVWSVVTVETGVGSLSCPFHPSLSCEDAAANLVQPVTLSTRGKPLQLGGTRSEAQRLLPGLEERNPELLCDAHSLCLVFLFDRLLEVKTYCTGPECWEEGWINQDALDRLKEWERETPEVLASTQDGKWKTTWRAKDGLLMHRETNWSHHLGRGENGWVAHRGLLCVAVALGKKKVDEDAPLSCP